MAMPITVVTVSIKTILDDVSQYLQYEIDEGTLSVEIPNAMRQRTASPKQNAPAPVADSASNADLKKLAEQVQEIDQKRADDREVILKQIDNLSKAVANTPVPSMP